MLYSFSNVEVAVSICLVASLTNCPWCRVPVLVALVLDALTLVAC